MNKKVLLWGGIAAAVLLCLCVGVFILGAGVTFFGLTSSEEPQDVSVDISAPSQATVGQSFDLLITIDNFAGRSRELNSIDVDADLLEGLRVTGTTPPADSHDTFGFFDSYFFYTSLPANGTAEVTLHLQAQAEGTYTGWVDTCIDDEASCVRRTISIAISK